MFEKRSLKNKDIYELRLWLLDLSKRLESKSSNGDKLVYKLGRQSEKLKEMATTIENKMTDLRVEYGTYNDGQIVVEKDTEQFDLFKDAFESLMQEKEEVEFLSRKIEDSELEEVKGITIADFDFLHLFS